MYKLIFITNNNIYLLYHILFILSTVSAIDNIQNLRFFCGFPHFSSSSLLFSIVKNEEEAPHRWGLFLLFYSLIVVFVIVILYVSFSRFQRLNFSISTSHFLDLGIYLHYCSVRKQLCETQLFSLNMIQNKYDYRYWQVFDIFCVMCMVGF